MDFLIMLSRDRGIIIAKINSYALPGWKTQMLLGEDPWGFFGVSLGVSSASVV